MTSASLSDPATAPKSRSESGYGLLYVLFLILGLAIAASIALLSQAPEQAGAGATLTWQRMDAIRDAVGRYKANVRSNPATLDGLLVKPATVPACSPDTNSASLTYRQLIGWCGPYLDNPVSGSDSFKRDGWNALLQYNGTTLVSCGPNRVCGDGDDITISL